VEISRAIDFAIVRYISKSKSIEINSFDVTVGTNKGLSKKRKEARDFWA
jgi:hypothetical protein